MEDVYISVKECVADINGGVYISGKEGVADINGACLYIRERG